MTGEFPKMLYRPGTKSRVWGVMVDTLVVRDAEEQETALGDGWTLRPVEETQEDPPGFTMKYVPVGRYEITGPGVSETIRGKHAAEARLAELQKGAKNADNR